MIRLLTVIGHGVELLPHFIKHYITQVDEINIIVYVSELHPTLTNDVDKIIKTNNNEPDKEALVFSCDYSNASKIWFYLQLKQVYVLSEFPFANTYRYWNTALFNNKNKLLNNNTAFYVCDNTSKENLAILNKYFNHFFKLAV